MAEGTHSVIRIDEIRLPREPLDMRAGPDTALARVINRFGEARLHCAYVFANKRANRMKVLVCDGSAAPCPLLAKPNGFEVGLAFVHSYPCHGLFSVA